ncbi:5-formyltetrahydrofolate cyclo-ligase [Loigolactobacillus backii]|uniref:5-formyltetrahydrofolate cyclo-ligase n=1 Tax=Loigolactobacillus backii TaxID=375175 RepID=UPI000C1CB725|nr:5-formyltetrahydrofolate cyclo-ligase [Loigolactobacillus backii]PIO83248.1 5-formyltetrahydrofolate cyclo-ligase [Loigolactobacillus backii]
MTKTTIRSAQLKRLNDYAGTVDKKIAEADLIQQLTTSTTFKAAQVIALTLSQTIELDTKPLIDICWQLGKSVYIPRVMPKRQMVFLPYTSTTKLVRSKFGLLEPIYNASLIKYKFDLFLVPGVAFSVTKQVRLGFGGGYYDRFLAAHPQNTVSLVLPPQYFTEPMWPVEAFDVKVQKFFTKG